MYIFIHVFVHSFIQQIFVEHLQYAKQSDISRYYQADWEGWYSAGSDSMMRKY